VDEEVELALQIPNDMEMVALAIPDTLLLELDIYCDSLRRHPSCPELIRDLPMWAFRSNVIQASIRGALEMYAPDDDLEAELQFIFKWYKDE
jgi:hypothetical protein|tara:strand:- start:17 stop:292 length:276 start_codon:yes stop_codon:yes gene_type:complete